MSNELRRVLPYQPATLSVIRFYRLIAGVNFTDHIVSKDCPRIIDTDFLRSSRGYTYTDRTIKKEEVEKVRKYSERGHA